MDGDTRAGAGRKRVGGRRREGGNREKLRKISQHFVIFAVEMGQRGGIHYRKEGEAGVKGTGSESKKYEKQEFH